MPIWRSFLVRRFLLLHSASGCPDFPELSKVTIGGPAIVPAEAELAVEVYFLFIREHIGRSARALHLDLCSFSELQGCSPELVVGLEPTDVLARDVMTDRPYVIRLVRRFQVGSVLGSTECRCSMQVHAMAGTRCILLLSWQRLRRIAHKHSFPAHFQLPLSCARVCVCVCDPLANSYPRSNAADLMVTSMAAWSAGFLGWKGPSEINIVHHTHTRTHTHEVDTVLRVD
uniref:Putative secreted protein n=1 Tax=Anopheles triannulatus TaxID=58253 RepID=A0A2M4B568_9DIPT